MGRWICISSSIYRHVVNGEKESRKLVVVDRYKHCFSTFVFCKRIGVYQFVLRGVAGDGCFWVGNVAEESCNKRKNP